MPFAGQMAKSPDDGKELQSDREDGVPWNFYWRICVHVFRCGGTSGVSAALQYDVTEANSERMVDDVSLFHLTPTFPSASERSYLPEPARKRSLIRDKQAPER
jgi:hypothetical protein